MKTGAELKEFDVNDSTRSPNLDSRTRPGKQPDPVAVALRGLRAATRDYLAALEAALKVLTPELVDGQPDLHYVRTALVVASGQRGASFGTAASIEKMLSRALGEQAS